MPDAATEQIIFSENPQAFTVRMDIFVEKMWNFFSPVSSFFFLFSPQLNENSCKSKTSPERQVPADITGNLAN